MGKKNKDILDKEYVHFEEGMQKLLVELSPALNLSSPTLSPSTHVPVPVTVNATTSATTYKTQVANADGTGAVSAQYSGEMSTITLLEIKA
jgi:hypothetical protein